MSHCATAELFFNNKEPFCQKRFKRRLSILGQPIYICMFLEAVSGMNKNCH